MKKSFLSLALLASTATAAFAQSAIPAGTISLGGSIGYSRQTDNHASTSSGGTATSSEATTSQFSFTPSVGYFVVDNLAVGLNVSYNATRKPYTTYTPAPSSVKPELDPIKTYQIGLYAQYYKMVTDQFGVVGTVGAGYQHYSNTSYVSASSSTNNDLTETTGSGFYAAVTPSIIYFPIPKFGISASIGSIGYSKISYDYPTNVGTVPGGYENKSSTFGARFGIDQLQFGGTYYFGR